MKFKDCLITLINYKVLGIFLLNTFSLFAQTEKIAFEKYGVAEGLPEEVGQNFLQDQQGFIWIGTQNGLAKYDGYEMTIFRSNPNDPDGLHLRNLIGGLILAEDGKIWIGGVSRNGGLASFDPVTQKFTNYPIDYKDITRIPYSNNSPLFEDIAKNIWFISQGNNENILCKIDPKTNKVSRYPYAVGRRRNSIVLNYQLAESKKDSAIWLNTQDQNILRYNRNKDLFEVQFKKGDVIPGTKLTDSIIDINSISNGSLITMSNNERLFLFDPIEKKVVETYEFSNRDDITWGAQFEDHYGNIWVTSHDNISIINRKKTEITNFKFGEGPLDFEFTGTVQHFIPEAQNENYIFFETLITRQNNEGHLHTLRYEFRTNSFDFFDYRYNDINNQIRDNGVPQNLMLDHTGLLWLGTRPNIYKEAPKTRQIAYYKNNPENISSLPNNRITKLFEDSKQQLWVGTEDGIAKKDSDNTFKTSESNRTFDIGYVITISEASNGSLWVGTDNGLYRWSTHKNSFEKLLTHFGDIPILAWSDKVYKGEIWISIQNQGVYILDENTGKIKTRFELDNSDEHGLTSATISSILLDSKGTIWMGDPLNNDQALFRYQRDKARFVHYTYNPEDSTSVISPEIHQIFEDDLNRIWITTDGGISLYNANKDNFLSNNDGTNLPSTNNYEIGPNGKVWVLAYSGGGLANIGPDINDLTMYGESSGLLHNDANEIIFDDYGKLWLPTERGLSVFDTITKKYTHYFEEDGFQKFSRFNEVLKTKNGDIWIGGEHGLNQITPSKLANKDPTKPAVFITDMKIMDSIYSAADGNLFKKAVSYSDQVKLKHRQKDLSFNFVGLHYLKPEDNQYSWKLENYDSHWSTPSKDRQVSYTNLSPGTYTFRVKASNADGIWNEEGASIKIIIAPPWWQTWWAYLFYVLLIGFIGLQIHKSQRARTLRLAQERAREKELEQAKEIEKAYNELQNTQEQLIQSEKMASLGELTAGIAHEIQNPLNFVNNFSEVNSELIEEMKEELDSGNLEEVKSLADDINENEKKIMFHGKRADSIVKGMLQHSRASGDKKEPTDINTLADEYMRLAYHGLRAKDKSFNATLETNFDDNIGKINIIPQDIGRVILNLFTNAFYAVSEKKAQLKKTDPSNTYKPTVSVTTKKTNQNVQIVVEDNGDGIPQKVIKKIFEPFFTTKPTGKGTGLGLSMSYDIIKTHGGSLDVKSEKGVHTQFKIILPINQD